MSKIQHELTRGDILPMTEYGERRKEKRAEIIEIKRNRRLEIGPHATLYFESYDTMWHQVHEMLHTEQGGDQQIDDELNAYNPLIPNGSELIATLMIEIDDPEKRQRFLAGIGGIEETLILRMGGHEIKAQAEQDIDRTTADGKASSVHFLHFPFTADQVDTFKAGKEQIVIAIDKPGYQHMAVMPEAVRQALVGDFD